MYIINYTNTKNDCDNIHYVLCRVPLYRVGYNTSSSSAIGGLPGFAVGLGFGFRGLDVGYAFVPMGDLGDTHRVLLSYSF